MPTHDRQFLKDNPLAFVGVILLCAGNGIIAILVGLVDKTGHPEAQLNGFAFLMFIDLVTFINIYMAIRGILKAKNMTNLKKNLKIYMAGFGALLFLCPILFWWDIKTLRGNIPVYVTVISCLIFVGHLTFYLSMLNRADLSQ